MINKVYKRLFLPADNADGLQWVQQYTDISITGHPRHSYITANMWGKTFKLMYVILFKHVIGHFYVSQVTNWNVAGE